MSTDVQKAVKGNGKPATEAQGWVEMSKETPVPEQKPDYSWEAFKKERLGDLAAQYLERELKAGRLKFRRLVELSKEKELEAAIDSLDLGFNIPVSKPTGAPRKPKQPGTGKTGVAPLEPSEQDKTAIVGALAKGPQSMPAIVKETGIKEILVKRALEQLEHDKKVTHTGERGARRYSKV